MAKTPVTKLVFKAIDVLYYRAQNRRRDVRKSGDLLDIEKDVPYDTRTLLNKVDIYKLKGEEKRPVVIFFHGGGWTAGDKRCRRDISKWFALNGYHVVNANYALCPEELFPTSIQDAAAVCNWTVENSEKYGFDTSRIILVGDSSGAYLALQTATAAFNTQFNEKLNCKMAIKPAGIILNCGMYDVEEALLVNKKPFDFGAKLLYSFTGYNRKNFQDYPYRDYISSLPHLNSSFPPCFVIYAKNDFFCKGQGEKLMLILKEKGIYCEDYASKIPTSNHVFSLNQRNSDAKAVDKLTLDFLARLCNDNINSSITNGEQ